MTLQASGQIADASGFKSYSKTTNQCAPEHVIYMDLCLRVLAQLSVDSELCLLEKQLNLKSLQRLTSCLCVQAGEQVQLMPSTDTTGDAALRKRAPATMHLYNQQKHLSVEVSCRLVVQPWIAAHSNASADVPQHTAAIATCIVSAAAQLQLCM